MQMFSFDRDWLVKNIGSNAYDNFTNVQKYNNRGDKRYLAISSGKPEVADVGVLKQDNNSGKGHTFMIKEVLGGNDTDGWKVKTIEGNTTLGGGREGEGVFSLTRTLKIGGKSQGMLVIGYIRRNFTPSELEALTYDEAQQTFVFAGQRTPTPSNAPKGSISAQLLKKQL